MKKYLLFLTAVCCAVVLLASCQKDEPVVNPAVSIHIDGLDAAGDIFMAQDSTLYLKAVVENAGEFTALWRVNGEQASDDAELEFTPAETGDYRIELEVLGRDGVQSMAQVEVKVYANAEVGITLDGSPAADEVSVPYFKSLKFKAEIKSDTDYTLSWNVNGESVSSDAAYEFTTADPGDYEIVLSAKNQYGGLYSAATRVNVYDFSKGTFVLNEGNMTSGYGSLIFISPNGALTDSLYWRVNGTFLGNAAQDMYIADKKMYVISQNGGGDGMLVVANAATLKKEAAYAKAEMSGLSMPTHIAVVGEKAYIRDNNGVSLFDLTTKAKQLITGSEGAAKNRMAVVGDKVFVPAGRSVYVIQGDAVVRTITMPGTVSGVVRASDDNLWVSCTTSPAQINKVSSADYSVLQTNELGDASVGAGFGATPGISAKADSIYFSNASTKIYRHIFSQNKTELLTDVKTHIDNAGIVYNNLAVNPQSGEVYFNTIKGYGGDFLINDITVFNFSRPTPLLANDYKDFTQFPAGIFFTYDFE